MTKSTEKNEVFTDYAAFLHALLPQAEGFMFHDRYSRLFWNDSAPDTSQLGDEYHDTLQRIIQHGELAGDAARIQLRDSVAYLIRIVGDKGKVLGVLTALVAKDMGGMPHKFCADLLRPALRSLARELTLRVHLLDANRKLTVQNTEHDFLHTLGEKSRESANCDDNLRSMLDLCVEHFSLGGATFFSPGRNLLIMTGEDATNKVQAELYFESLHERFSTSTDSLSGTFSVIPDPGSDDRNQLWPVLQDGKSLMGVLVLSQADCQKPTAATVSANMGSFIASTIEYVVEKGFDSVTGLINWASFESALKMAAHETGSNNSILYLDLDQLHVINDTCGRETGDYILRELAKILRLNLPDQSITRVTSDSFAALLKGINRDKGRKIAQAICDQVAQLETAPGDSKQRCTASIGIAALENSGDNPATLLVPAQVACEAAKERGRGRVEVYESADLSIIKRMDDLNLVGSIRSAIEGGRLVLFAQPIIPLTGESESAYYELLVRMLNTAGEPIPPSEFMGAAEKYQLMMELDRWVISKAIDTLTDQQTNMNGRSLRFAVNLSGQSVGNEKFLKFVKDELARTGLSPDRLCLEITETVAVGNLKKAQVFMRELQELGCQFSLDDFGTGLSSFAYLKMLPVNKLKIDGSFVHDISTNEVSRSMVSAIAEIARVMKIETVAEYVQDQATLRVIEELGVNWGQGFYLGEPVRLKDLFGNSTIIDKADLADVDPTLIRKLPAAID